MSHLQETQREVLNTFACTVGWNHTSYREEVKMYESTWRAWFIVIWLYVIGLTIVGIAV